MAKIQCGVKLEIFKITERRAKIGRECGDSRVWYEYFGVATRDVLSYALVSPESFPVESTRVLFLVSTV